MTWKRIEREKEQVAWKKKNEMEDGREAFIIRETFLIRVCPYVCMSVCPLASLLVNLSVNVRLYISVQIKSCCHSHLHDD